MKSSSTVIEASGRDRLGIGAWLVMFRELYECRELISRLIRRNIAGQFRQSFMGYVWIVLPPIALTLVFSLLRAANIVLVPDREGGMPYGLYVLIGSTVWGAFTQATITATTSIANAGNLVSKIYFPREALVVSSVGASAVNVLVQVGVIALAFLLFGFMPHIAAMAAIILFVPVYLFGIGLGFFLAPINTMMNDTARILQFLFQFGMFLAPTVYPTPLLAHVESNWQMMLYLLHHLNPISYFIYAFHGLVESGTLAFPLGLAIASGISVFTLLVGWRFFHICEPFLAERL